jgi:hypothetical protein
MKEHFNVYYHLAGIYAPFWLSSRSEISAGAKLSYALLAQQANSRNITQLNLQMLSAALGEMEGDVAGYLMELEKVKLIEAQRGNINSEDIRVFFPPHPWMRGLEKYPTGGEFKMESAELQPSLLFQQEEPKPDLQQLAAVDVDSKPGGKRRSRKRHRSGPAKSKHSLETCVRFITYQKEVLGHDHIWSVMGLAQAIWRSGSDDLEIDLWLKSNQASSSAA